MRVALFCHSLLSDWNHGNAHFLRGVVTELVQRGHAVEVHEAHDAWSVENLVRDHGQSPLEEVRRVYPDLVIVRYDARELDLDRVLDGVDLVLVHEWTPHDLVAQIGAHRARHGNYRLLFHDTDHRSVTNPESVGAFELDAYDGVLAFGETIRARYLARGWARRVWTWHEAADTRVFRPLREEPTEVDGEVVFIGNWGDDERTAELETMFVGPVRDLGLRAHVHGVRYPEAALDTLATAGISYGGWLPNYRVPSVFARYMATVHVPRRPYVAALPGIPTIRPFEAMASGICLVSAPWEDSENLFTPGADYLVARSPDEMRRHLRALAADPDLRAALRAHALATVRRRHTCAHRVDELLAIVTTLGVRRD